MVNVMILGRCPENHQGGLDFFPVDEGMNLSSAESREREEIWY